MLQRPCRNGRRFGGAALGGAAAAAGTLRCLHYHPCFCCCSLNLNAELTSPAGLPQLPARRAARRGAAQVRASFLGVGAPEAILVGVVALVVFGPKGLAQVRRHQELVAAGAGGR